MRALRALLQRLAATLSGPDRDEEFARELDAHLQMHVDDNLRRGMTPDEARRTAILRLGGVAQARESYRDRARVPIVDSILQDVVYAARTLMKERGFTATAVLTLALGIGATSAIFSVVNAVLLRPLPFHDPGRLVMVFAMWRQDTHEALSYPAYADFRDQSHSFESAAAFASRSVTVTTGGEAELLQAKRVTPSLFRVLGAHAARGRLFRDDEERPAESHVVILSDGFWRRRYGAAPDVLGQILRVNDEPYTIVGVMPPEFHIDPPEREQLYAPLPIDASRNHSFLRMIARLRPGVGRAQSQQDLVAIAQRLAKLYPRTNEAASVNVEPLVDGLVGASSRAALLILLGVVALVLLLACTNIASLLLARSASRRRELAVRAALGAGRGRLVRQLLTESVMLAAAGGAAGMLLAGWLAQLLVVALQSSVQVPRLESTRTDTLVLTFTALVAAATGVLFGIVPALSSAAPDLNDALRDGCRTSTGARGPRLRRTLVVLETALALVLLAGAGVLMKTLLTLRTTSPGFDTRNMLAVDLWLPPVPFPTVAERAAFFDAALSRVRALPGVRAATFVADLPLNGGSDSEGFHIVGRPDPSPGRWFQSGFNIASAGYFTMMGIPIREGRDFLDSDRASAPGALIVNESAARRFWPGENPVGRQILLPISAQRSQLLTVVGVAADVRHVHLADPPRPELFVHSMQTELSWPFLVLAVRTDASPASIAGPVRAAVRAASADVPITRLNTMDEVVDRSIAGPRLFSLLFGAFALAALTLSAIGLYGLISYSVAQRTHEMGVRIALGAPRAAIVRLVLAQGAGLAVLGTALGIAGGLAATRVLVGVVKGVHPTDPITFVIVTTTLLACALLASYLPARRAAQADPIAALRAE